MHIFSTDRVLPGTSLKGLLTGSACTGAGAPELHISEEEGALSQWVGGDTVLCWTGGLGPALN